MSIQKKSLISTLQSTKKANIAKEAVTPEGTTKAAGLKASPVRAALGTKAVLKLKATTKKAAGKTSSAYKLSDKRSLARK